MCSQGYDEIQIPALKPKSFAPDETLVPITSLPNYAQLAFDGYKNLNRIQSKVCLYAYVGREGLQHAGKDWTIFHKQMDVIVLYYIYHKQMDVIVLYFLDNVV